MVGGGNSAGQAAVFLAQTARRVYMFVRADGLAESMSRYLIRRIEDNPKIELRTRTEIDRARGRRAAGAGPLAQQRHRREEAAPIGHVFVMTGAVPNTAWLDGCVALDASGFIKTGADLVAPISRPRAGRCRARRTCSRRARPGVFAVGDVRGGNVKRVASAVGEGSIAVSFVHQALAE